MSVVIVHDWDFPLYQRKTCIRRAFWLVFYAIFGRFRWARRIVPRWLMYEKYSQALALAELDRLLGVRPIFGITKEVEDFFPDIVGKIRKMGFDVRLHYHVRQREVGRGRWHPPLNVKPLNMVYDRRYVMGGERELPQRGEPVVWHVDHMSYNLYYFIFLLEFIRRCREAGLL